jgi:hypothetical protein
MFRALAILASFALISPAIRNVFSDVYRSVDELVQAHTGFAYAATGALGFISFLAVRLTAKK